MEGITQQPQTLKRAISSASEQVRRNLMQAIRLVGSDEVMECFDSSFSAQYRAMLRVPQLSKPAICDQPMKFSCPLACCRNARCVRPIAVVCWVSQLLSKPPRYEAMKEVALLMIIARQ
jgi:hypothetical protein